MDANKTIEKLRGESGKEKYSLYLTVETMDEFKKEIHPFKPSRVIDELIKEFLESRKKSKPRIRAKKPSNKKN